MGFGILFFGYFAAFLMSFNSYGAIFAMIGYYVIFTALQRLSEYKHSIMRCILPLAAMFLCSATEAATLIFNALGASSPFEGQIISYLISLVSLASNLIFHLFLFGAIAELGKDTELPDVVGLSRTDTFVVCVYFLLNVVVFILANLFEIQYPLLVAATLILRIVYPLFGLSLIYKCFQKICAPEDISMPTKPSRFKFINDIRERNEKKAQETCAAREELLKKNSASAKPQKQKKKK